MVSSGTFSIDELWESPILVTNIRTYENDCFELTDSSATEKVYNVYGPNSEGKTILKFDSDTGKRVYYERTRSYSSGGFSFASQETSGSVIKSKGCYFYKNENNNYCYANEGLYKDGTLIKETYYHNIKNETEPLRIDYTIHYEYPHPTLEKRTIYKDKKKYEVLIRKQFYSPVN